jgi:phosphatidylglycerol:prolipoprotein diacylglycerol transferase
MWPTLFEVGDVRVGSYALLMVLGYAAALFVVLRLARAAGETDRASSLTAHQAWDLYIVMVVSSILGAKLGHVLFEAPGHIFEGERIDSLWELLKADPLHALRLGEGGYVWYGGLIGALLTAVVYFRRRPELNALQYSDAFAPAIMMGAALGRVGCFLSGCCYGVPTGAPWGVAFPATDGVAVHPTQLYDASFAAIFGLFLLWWFPRRRFNGENISLLLIGYPVARFLTEVFRGDPERGHLGPLSTSQIISVVVLAAGAGLYAWARRRSDDRSADTGSARVVSPTAGPSETTGRSAG